MGIGTQDINKKLKRDSGRPSTPRKDLQIWAPLTYMGFLLVSISIILESLADNDVNAAVREGTVCNRIDPVKQLGDRHTNHANKLINDGLGVLEVAI
ncbi:hypothetical protein C5167_039349 [Papaver somniferum]|uniref:Uncharacterized protein n=1 Tax=Papaver somniferum TaxID=3469 RepID=A0A4Y7IG17_PAPSO|nr:hypothetical protein C5167_039349 [Papaver somniferum]